MFTLIAYKPDSDDYCRGCHMASYSSDCIVRMNLTPVELVQEWAKLQTLETGTGEAGYDILVLANVQGYMMQVAATGSIDYNGEFNIPEHLSESPEYITIEDVMGKVSVQVTATIEEIVKARKAALELKNANDIIASKKIEEARSRAEYERLKALFEKKD